MTMLSEQFIDIHSHILPGFDDGARTMGEAVEMARIALAAGTGLMFATPHIASPGELVTSEQIAERVAELQSALDSEGISLRVVPGAEVFLSAEILPAIDRRLPITLGPSRKYVLLDTPRSAMPLGLEQLIFDLQTRGVTPILAHPERSAQIQQDPELLESLVQRGALVQINGASLMGRHGSKAAEAALIYLRHRWVHFVASDAHSVVHRRPSLSSAEVFLGDEFGQDRVIELFNANAVRVLNGEDVPTNPAVYAPRNTGNPFQRALRRLRRAA